jgi:ketosteroid isomerase-like protein
MSQAHVELVRKAFEAFKSGEMEAVLPFYTPDVVCYPVSEWLEDPVYRGHEGALRLTAWTDNFDDVAFEAHEIREVEEQVVVLAELTGQIRDSGVPIRQAFGVIH